MQQAMLPRLRGADSGDIGRLENRQVPFCVNQKRIESSEVTFVRLRKCGGVRGVSPERAEGSQMVADGSR
jgi:hypothetical protein